MNKNGKLIILSGPSGVGKGPLSKSLFLYAQINNIKIEKHVLYTSRKIRNGEQQGETYHFYTPSEIKEREENAPDDFITFRVHGDIQGMNMAALRHELMENTLVFVEVYYEIAPYIIQSCKQQGINVSSVFVKPLSDEDYDFLGCGHDDVKKEIATRAVMYMKLTNRCTETPEKVQIRAKSAYAEIKNHVGYDLDLVNHFGEDNRTMWSMLYEYLKKPNGLDEACSDDTLRYLAGMFKEFLEFVL